MARRRATSKLSFGYARIEILGALASTLIIWVLTLFLLWEAVNRLRNPAPIDAPMMLGTALIGVFVNILMAAALHGGHDGCSHGTVITSSHSHAHSTIDRGTSSEEEGVNHERDPSYPLLGGSAVSFSKRGWFLQWWDRVENMDVNVRSAAIHIIGDIVSSIGVVFASVVILVNPSLTVVDPICTFFFSGLVLATTFSIMKSSISILMEGTPHHITPSEITKALLEIPLVVGVHDLHIWSLTQSRVSLSVHLVLAPTVGETDGGDDALAGSEGHSHEHTHKHGDDLEENNEHHDVHNKSKHQHYPNHLNHHNVDIIRQTTLNDYAKVLELAQGVLFARFGIHHATIQIDPPRRKESSGDGVAGMADVAGSVVGITRKGGHDYCLPVMCQQ